MSNNKEFHFKGVNSPIPVIKDSISGKRKITTKLCEWKNMPRLMQFGFRQEMKRGSGYGKRKKWYLKTVISLCEEGCIKVEYLFNIVVEFVSHGSSSPFCLRCHYKMRKSVFRAKMKK